MRLSTMILFFWVVLIRQTLAVASYDEYRDADDLQSGYLPNHNMDPSVVDSASFGQLWKVPFLKNEQFYAKPLTYTPLAAGPQLLFLASTMNWIRTLDAKTGAIINARQLHTPFLQSDIGCTDIANYIGIIGTPVIDPVTDIVYLYSKTYIANYRVPGAIGTANGVYYFHAISITTLADVYPPVLVDGSVADNDPRKYFHGGVILQRPSLTQIGSVIYGGFGGHCDLFNYTGVIIGIDINKWKIVTQFAMESGPLAAQTNSLLQNAGGGEAGLWMSGMGLATDGSRLFSVTGNGVGHQNGGTPASGTSGCQTLGEAVVNLGVDGTGVLSLTDYFQPYDYQNMDAGDQDLGSGGIVMLDPATFSGGSAGKIAVTAGKNGKIYIINVNNLGGYKLGPGQADGIVQTITSSGAIFGAAGSYPLEGGFIYVTPTGYPTTVYSLGFDSTGLPQFSKAGQSVEISAGRVGVGVPTITSLNGKPGTAILWMTDPDVGLRAWYAVPQMGVLKSIALPQVKGANKFQRPVFGNQRVYVTDATGIVYCLGSPVNLPLNCTSPVDFGQVALGNLANQTINCTANIAITAVTGLEMENTLFHASNASLPKGPLKIGDSFSIPVTFDLTNTTLVNDPNTTFQSISPGVKSTPLTLITINAVAGYATVFPISLTGTEVSRNPFLSVTPSTVDYGGAIILVNGSIPVNQDIITIGNQGLAPLTILGYAYTYKTGSNAGFVNSTIIGGAWDLGYGFTAPSLPPIGSQIAPNAAVAVGSAFTPTNGTGAYVSYWQVWSDGGAVSVILEGSASTAPLANFSISTSEGGWLPQANLLMDFGTVSPGSSSSLQIRLCNQGGSSLEIDKSKPPNGEFHISDPTELHESQLIPPGGCAYGTVLFNPNVGQYNLPDRVVANTWTLNNNDLTWGVHVITITGKVVSKKVGPTNSTGLPVYSYLGCFQESTNGPRLFPNEPLAPGPMNNNDKCQTACYNSSKYVFAGTEYADECYCGNTPPPLVNQDLTNAVCNAACPGDGADSCGATGYLSVFYDPTRYVAGTDPALYGPQTIKVVANYNFLGCYSEGTNGRALTGKTPPEPTGGFTIENCEAGCVGYTYFGMEYGNQCYCGNTLGAGSVNQASSTPSVNGCNMICKGNQLEYCGGPSRLNLYGLNVTAVPTSTITSSAPSDTGTSSKTSGTLTSGTLTSTSSATSSSIEPTTVTNLPGWEYLGCYSEASSGRALSSLANPIPGATNSVEACAKACSSYILFGVEYSRECYCGNIIQTGSVNQSSSDPNTNGCNMVCANNPGEYCGGSNRLNIYEAAPSSVSPPPSPGLSSSSSSQLSSTSSPGVSSSGSSVASSSSSSISTSNISPGPSTTSSESSPSWTGTPSTGQKINTWQYLGCANEASSSRALIGSSYTSSNAMTIEACQSFCATNNYALAGLEYASQCYCANSLTSGAAVGQTGCTMSCNGNVAELCGSGNRLSLFNNTAYVYPSILRTLGKFAYRGCFSESSKGRLLSGPSFSNTTGMTVESCVAFCQAKLPSSSSTFFAGVEYAQECYCGNTLPAGATLKPDSNCNMVCKGNHKEFCGAAGMVAVYVK